jgi:hypothetical protein
MVLDYFIHSPMEDQSLAISGLLRKYFPNVDIVGVIMDGEVFRGSGGCYSRIITAAENDILEPEGVQIPSAAISTKNMLEQGDVTLGSITMTQAALRVFDKPWMIAKAAEAGVPVPETWQRAEKLATYPLFYKPRYEHGSGMRGIARTSQEVPKQWGDNLIFQELIDTPGTYGVGFLASKGRLLTTYTHFERESIPKEGGSAVIIERFEDERLLEYTRLLVQSLDYSGWGLAEYKYCGRRDDYVFMEINAKFWASCEFAFINEPLFLKLLFNIESREKPVQRMVFLDRAFARGIPFILKNYVLLCKVSKLRLYPGWVRRIAAELVPNRFRKPLKMLLQEDKIFC